MKFLCKKDTKEEPCVFTPWSLIHLTSGAASREYLDFWVGQAGHIAYEAVGSKAVWKAFGDDTVRKSSFENSVGDHAAFTAGQCFLKGYYWKWITLGLFAVYQAYKVELPSSKEEDK